MRLRSCATIKLQWPAEQTCALAGAIRTGLLGGLCIVRVFERGFCVRLQLRCIYSPPCYSNGRERI